MKTFLPDSVSTLKFFSAQESVLRWLQQKAKQPATFLKDRTKYHDECARVGLTFTIPPMQEFKDRPILEQLAKLLDVAVDYDRPSIVLALIRHVASGDDETRKATVKRKNKLRRFWEAILTLKTRKSRCLRKRKTQSY